METERRHTLPKNEQSLSSPGLAPRVPCAIGAGVQEPRSPSVPAPFLPELLRVAFPRGRLTLDNTDICPITHCPSREARNDGLMLTEKWTGT